MSRDDTQSTRTPPSSSTLHLFWPSDHPLDSTGYLIGWNIETVYCVATLLENRPISSSNQPIELLNGSLENSRARILGQLNPANDFPRPPSPTQRTEEWIAIMNSRGTPRIKRSKAEEETILVIYDRPSMRRHHFFSLRPLLKPSLVSNHFTSPSKPSGNEPLAQKIKSFDQLYPQRAMPGPECGHPREMSGVIKFLNSSEDVHNKIHRRGTPKSLDRKAKPRPDAHHYSHQPTYHLDSILALSAFLQQFNVRLVEISSWPSRYRKINREEDADLSGRRAEYVMLFNTLWLIANDIIFGRTIGAILMENSEHLANWVEYNLQTYTVALVKSALHWTNSYPVGLKLNDQLGQAFCLCSNMAVDFWHIYVLKHAYLILPKMIWMVGFVGLFGNTFALAIASDFLTIATFHLWIIYRLFTFIFDCQLRFLGVLFNIFRGRKYNVLRKRNEPATYQLDQLILGTILFTLAIFLFPTILAFYILASTTRVLIVWVHGIIGTGLALLNHFPLFVLMLRLKDPARLPSGVCFIPLLDQGVVKFKLQNVPVGLSWIFSDYISLWVNLTSHYSPPLLLYHLCSGKPIAPLTNRATVYKRP